MASNTINLSTYRAKLLSNTYGANNSPVYINAGVPTILTTVGSTTLPVWSDAGVLKGITSYEGNAATATTASYLDAPNEAGFSTDEYGNFIHKRTTNTDNLHFDNNGKTISLKYYWETGNLIVPGELSVGSRGTTSGPSSITYSNRLTIVPYFHTGGPWYIKSGDDSSNAHLALYYGSTQIQQIRHDGVLSKTITFDNANIGIRRVGRSVNWVDGRDSAVVATTSLSGYGALASIKTKNGSWDIGAYDNSSYYDDLLFSYCTDTDHASATYNNRTTAQIRFYENGHILAALDGNASTASKILDSNNSTAITASYASGGVSSFSWATVWNGYHLTYISKADLMSQIRGAASGSWGISITGNAATATTASSCAGNALTCTYPLGFASRTTGATWGNTTGTSFTSWNDSTGGSIDFRRDNPSSGKMSIKVDGRFYGNEGTYPAMLMNYTNNYWGMGDPDAGASNWIRTTSSGIIPYQSGGAGSGHCGLGTSTWYFSYVYADNFYGKLNGNCTGSSGSCTGNAATATHATTFGSAAACKVYFHNSDECNFAGTNTSANLYFNYRAVGEGRPIPTNFVFGGSGGSATIKAGKVLNAVWNDFAEFREVDTDEPGRVVIPTNNGIATKSNNRLQPNGRVISDTYGCAVGESEAARTPLGMAGRVLAYPYRPIEEYQIGDCVCTAPNGTVDIMTREEIKEWPDRIIGIVNEIPSYEIWEQKLIGHDPNKSDVAEHATIQRVKVNGRIWIDIK